MRLFLALKPDRPAQAQLARRLLQIQEALGGAASVLRWTPSENIHLTIHFLGEVDRARADQLADQLGGTLAERPFEVAFGDVGSFPATGPPRVVWLDLAEGREPLERIHRELGRRLTAAGFALELRPLSPHLTLARVPDRNRMRASELRDRLRGLTPGPVAWMADRVTLFRSDLSGPVPKYEGLFEIPFGSGGADADGP